MNTPKSEVRHVVLKIESYEGQDTYLRCGDDQQDFLYAVIAVNPDGTAEVVDSSYRTLAEAFETWPEAKPWNGKRDPR
jgi:hypothetical protein